MRNGQGGPVANSLKIAEKFIIKNAIKKFLRASAENLIYKESVLKLFIVGYHNSSRHSICLVDSCTDIRLRIAKRSEGIPIPRCCFQILTEAATLKCLAPGARLCVQQGWRRFVFSKTVNGKRRHPWCTVQQLLCMISLNGSWPLLFK